MQPIHESGKNSVRSSGENPLKVSTEDPLRRSTEHKVEIAVKKVMDDLSDSEEPEKTPTFLSIDNGQATPVTVASSSSSSTDSRSSLSKRRNVPGNFSSLDVSYDSRSSNVQENEEVVISRYQATVQSIKGTRKPILGSKNASYEIKNEKGETCKIQHIMSLPTNMCVQGRFSEVFLPMEGSAEICPGVPNSKIVIKILRDDKLRPDKDCSSTADTAEKKIDLALKQFAFLKSYFREEEHPPIVMIYNADRARECGYTVVQKVSPLKLPLWDKNALLSALSTEQKGHYNTLVKLLKANQALKDAKISEMDLKLDNLGLDEQNNLVLLDYVNTPFLANDFDDTAEKRLSMGNLNIEKQLELDSKNPLYGSK